APRTTAGAHVSDEFHVRRSAAGAAVAMTAMPVVHGERIAEKTGFVLVDHRRDLAQVDELQRPGVEVELLGGVVFAGHREHRTPGNLAQKYRLDAFPQRPRHARSFDIA